jgi:hypothetical protein
MGRIDGMFSIGDAEKAACSSYTHHRDGRLLVDLSEDFPVGATVGQARNKGSRSRLLGFRSLTPLGAGFDARRLHHFLSEFRGL